MHGSLSKILDLYIPCLFPIGVCGPCNINFVHPSPSDVAVLLLVQCSPTHHNPPAPCTSIPWPLTSANLTQVHTANEPSLFLSWWLRPVNQEAPQLRCHRRAARKTAEVANLETPDGSDMDNPTVDGTWADAQALMYPCAVGNAQSHVDAVIGTDADPHILTCKDAFHDLQSSGGKIFQHFTNSVALRHQEQKASGQPDAYAALARSRPRQISPSSTTQPDALRHSTTTPRGAPPAPLPAAPKQQDFAAYLQSAFGAYSSSSEGIDGDDADYDAGHALQSDSESDKDDTNTRLITPSQSCSQVHARLASPAYSHGAQGQGSVAGGMQKAASAAASTARSRLTRQEPQASVCHPRSGAATADPTAWQPAPDYATFYPDLSAPFTLEDYKWANSCHRPNAFLAVGSLDHVAPHKRHKASQVIKDKDVVLRNATATDVIVPAGENVVHINCVAHAHMHVEKCAPDNLEHHDALLVPLTDDDDMVRYLGRVEDGVPIDSMDSKRQGNVCIVNWDKVPEAGIYYCLCADHALRGICLHILLWLVTKGIITPPPKWSDVRVGGPSCKGRDRHYVDGSALLRDLQPSLHARAKVAKGLQDPRVRPDTRMALVACKGTICLENDSIRKYATKDYKYGMQKP